MISDQCDGTCKTNQVLNEVLAISIKVDLLITDSLIRREKAVSSPLLPGRGHSAAKSRRLSGYHM